MADKFKSIAKSGWHPEKDRAANSDGGGGRLGQVKGMLGRGSGGSSHVEAAKAHQSAPLSSLIDPSTFAPPPKRLDYGTSPVASRSTQPTTPTASAHSTSTQQRLPAASPATASKPKPSLPPRLPPRQNSNPNEYAPAPPPTYNEAVQEASSAGMLNQGALNRLGQAGVAVPGLGVGRTASPPVPPRRIASPPVPPRQSPTSAIAPAAAPPAATGHGSQLGALQSRFSSMSTGSPTSPGPATGTSWADKQAALRTASSLRDDPSKVSATDMKNAASTANNLQQRHGAQVASGLKAASGLNQKYGIAGSVNKFASGLQSSSTDGKKAAPPPPPPKKRELAGSVSEPPPIPLGSKPKF